MQISYSYKVAIVGTLTFILIAILSLTANASELSKISINQLKLILDNPGVAVIDVRVSRDWQSSGFKIKGAIRGSPEKFESWAHDFSKSRTLILY